jgi:hypothetical protein
MPRSNDRFSAGKSNAHLELRAQREAPASGP